MPCLLREGACGTKRASLSSRVADTKAGAGNIFENGSHKMSAISSMIRSKLIHREWFAQNVGDDDLSLDDINRLPPSAYRRELVAGFRLSRTSRDLKRHPTANPLNIKYRGGVMMRHVIAR